MLIRFSLGYGALLPALLTPCVHLPYTIANFHRFRQTIGGYKSKYFFRKLNHGKEK